MQKISIKQTFNSKSGGLTMIKISDEITAVGLDDILVWLKTKTWQSEGRNKPSKGIVTVKHILNKKDMHWYRMDIRLSNKQTELLNQHLHKMAGLIFDKEKSRKNESIVNKTREETSFSNIEFKDRFFGFKGNLITGENLIFI